MSEYKHLNKVVSMLENGELPLATIPFRNGDEELAREIGDSDLDLAIIEMEHQGFSYPYLRTTLQSMLNRGRIAKDGLVPSVVPIARVPSPGSEVQEWIIKQTLDLGVYGIVVPRIETGDQVLKVLNAMRYPAKRNSICGGGRRGYWPTVAARYWGISDAEYCEHADVWPLNSIGDLLFVPIIESRKGVENIDEILDVSNGISMVMCGPGDFAAEAGAIGDGFDPEVVEWTNTVQEACRKRNIPLLGGVADPKMVSEAYSNGIRVFSTYPFASPDTVKAIRSLSNQVKKYKEKENA